MNNEEFRQVAIRSCELYYDSLKEMQKKKNCHIARVVVNVTRIASTSRPGEFVLFLSQRLPFYDACQVWVDFQECKHIFIRKYEGTRGKQKRAPRILVEVEESYLPTFFTLSSQRIEIISDMTFLIKRLSGFYSSCDINLVPPTPKPLPELPGKLTDPMSDEQRAAYDGAFSAPVSYVWGAPGTGKTKMVLSRCILRYVLAGKRVLLLGPTNNAIEQVLRGILPVMKEASVDLERVYRIGTASSEFASEYPQVVGDRELESLLSDIKAEQLTLSTEITAAQKYEDTLHELEQTASLCVTQGMFFTDALNAIFNARATEQTLLTEMNTQRDIFEPLAQQFHQKQTALTEKTDLRKSCESSIRTNQTQIDHLHFWNKKKRVKLEAERGELLSLLNSLKKEEAAAKEQADYAETLSNTAREAYLNVQKNHSESLTRCQFLQNQLASHRFDIPEYQAIAKDLRHNCTEDLLVDIVGVANDAQEKLEAHRETAPAHSLESLLAQRDALKKQLAEMGQSEKLRQRREALVLAGTIDAAVSGLSPLSSDDKAPAESKDELPISHVFIDEAGYTSIARGMVAFAYNCPVSFFGDHKQLPPICELNTIRPEVAEICLFTLPVAHYPAVLEHSIWDLYDRFYDSRHPQDAISSPQMPMYPLNKTYRFGDSLAQLLGRYFYSSDFRGDPNQDFIVTVLDVQKQPGTPKRTNLAECQAIREYLLAQQDLTSVAVLSPYKNQITALANALNIAQLRDMLDVKEDVLTVHRSQGREWDTVILSVCDTADRFLTDSNIPDGRSVLNTAISRTRRNLVIACDVSYWSRQDGQLISELIALGNANT